LILAYLAFEQSVYQSYQFIAKREKIVIRKVNCIYTKILRIFFVIQKIIM